MIVVEVDVVVVYDVECGFDVVYDVVEIVMSYVNYVEYFIVCSECF